MNYSATDDLSGITRFYINFTSPSQKQSQFMNDFPARVRGIDGSGPVTFPQFSEEGTWTATTAYLEDAVGNWASLSAAELAQKGFPNQITVTSKRDTTAPATAVRIAPVPNINGWNRGGVNVLLAAVDSETGVNKITVSLGGAETGIHVLTTNTAQIAVSAEGVTSVSYFATDNAGNNETTKTLIVKIDKTSPIASASASPVPNANGWNSGNVIVSFAGTDALSGIDSCSGPSTLTTEGAGQIISGTCRENADNVSSPAVARVNVDKTPPVISGMPNAGCILWPPTGKLVTVATVTTADALSGIAPGSFEVSAMSNETTRDPQIHITPNGVGGYVIQLQADRLGNGTGRIYTLSARASDLAGNKTTRTATCLVPHDQRN